MTHHKLKNHTIAIYQFCFFFLLFFPLILYSRQRTYQHIEHTNPPYIPWFTGSLLPPSAVNAQPGHPVFAPYVAFTLTYGYLYPSSVHVKNLNT